MSLPEAHCLEAELELVARGSLQTLVEHMGSAVNALRNSIDDGVHTVWLELVPSGSNLDAAIARYAAIFDELPPSLRTLWNSCTDRCVNVGLQAGFRPHAFPLLASHESIEALGRLGLRLQMTVYAPEAPLPRQTAA